METPEIELPPKRSKKLDGIIDPREKRSRDRIDWEAVENAYVWGETLSQRQDGSYVRKYPTFKELGAQFQAPPATVHYYAKRGNWADRRLKAITKTKEEFDVELAKSRGRRTANVVEVLESWIMKFGDDLEKGKVKTDSVADLNTVVRLHNFVLGKGDSRTEHTLKITLEALAERHAAQRPRIVEAQGEIAGELGDEDALTGALPQEEEGEAA